MAPLDVSSLVALAINAHALLLSGGIFLLLRLTKSAKWLGRSRVYRTVLPFLPAVLGTGAVFAGAVPCLTGCPWPLSVAEGLVCGWVAEKFHDGVLGRIVLGDHPLLAEPRKKKEKS